jgi:sugar lactone lactonase YvrE
VVFHPKLPLAAIQHVGNRSHKIVLFDLKQQAILSEHDIPKSWSGMDFSQDGKTLFVSGGVDDLIYRLLLIGTKNHIRLQRGKKLPVGNPKVLDLPSGLCAAPDGGVFVPLQRSNQLLRIGPKGATLFTTRLPPGSFPFECVFSSKQNKVFVSLWGKSRVVALNANSGKVTESFLTGQHPSALVLDTQQDRLFVSNGNENSVSVIDLKEKKILQSLTSSLYPDAPPGSTPNSLSLDPRGKILLVANADNNNLAVFDVSEKGKGRNLGFIPVGWYPTAVHFFEGGKRILVANGKGSNGSRANPGLPNSSRHQRFSRDHYSGSMFLGSLSLIDFPSPKHLGLLSKRALACSPLGKLGRRKLQRPKNSPIPLKPGGKTPIRYCVYIIKENRTYDQVLGDMKQGNGDPKLCLFPKIVTPNHHAIASEFVLLDNFYVEAEVSADGHEWTMGAYATDFVERTWPVTYGGKGSTRLAGKKRAGLGYPAEGNFDISTPKNGYLFDAAKKAGISYRSYGEFVSNPQKGKPGKARIKSLVNHCDTFFPSFDMRVSDQKRIDRFLQELASFEKKNELPRLIILRLPNDHTWGTRQGRPTPRAYLADNDLALGRVLEALSKTRFWKEMAVFVVEDDAQNGHDHVDAHRTVALVAGPYVKRGVPIHTMYSTSSMLRTIELVLGLEPLSQFDAAAQPMYACFTSNPNYHPYTCRKATWPLDETNSKNAFGRKRSEEMNFEKEDAIDDFALNEILWKSIMGTESPSPAPVRAAFVRKVEDD